MGRGGEVVGKRKKGGGGGKEKGRMGIIIGQELVPNDTKAKKRVLCPVKREVEKKKSNVARAEKNWMRGGGEQKPREHVRGEEKAKQKGKKNYWAKKGT